jgi:hypothetical protein
VITVGGKRRMQFGVVVIAILAAFVLSAAGSAGLPPVTGVPFPSHDGAGNPCPGYTPTLINERHYCLVVTTYTNLASVGGVEVDLTIQNYDQSSLTNITANLNLLTSLSTGDSVSFVSSSPATCAAASGGAACTFPNIPGVGSVAGTPPLQFNPATIKLYFDVAAADLPGLDFTAAATVKESGNDNGQNLQKQTVDDASMTFGSTNPGQGATVGLPGKHPKLNVLEPTNATTASVEFSVPAGSAPFLARFAADAGPTACFGGITCSGLRLSTDLNGTTYSVAPYILWQAFINSTNTNVDAIHYYDAVSVTAVSGSKTLTPTTSFAACDGVRFGTELNPTAPSPLVAGTDYFVVNATQTSFQVATSANGKAITINQSGSFPASCIRVIGDQKAEKVTSATPATSCATVKTPSQVPALYAAKQPDGTVLVCLWDTANGNINV